MTETRKFSILVVDDEKSNILALMDILKPEYTVLATRSGQGAIEMAEKHLPDIILLDIIMPDMDGYEVIEVLKNSVKTRHIPVIFVTGLSSAGDEEKGFALGAADYIIKPFSPMLVRLRVAGAVIDITEKKRMAEMLKQRDIMLSAVNRAASVLLTAGEGETFLASLQEGMEIIGRSVDADCVEVWQNEMRDGELYAVLKHYWFSETGLKIKSGSAESIFPYSSVPLWKKKLSAGEYIQGPVSGLSREEQDFLSAFKIKTVLVIPTFIQNQFWGFCCIDDCRNTRNFTDDEVDILHSGTYMLTNAINRSILFAAIQEANLRTKILLDKTPLCCQLWDSNLKKVDCNEAAVKLFGFKDKQEFLDRYSELYPEYQSDGRRSDEKAGELVNKAFKEGRHECEWTYKLLDGSLMPSEVILVRVEYEGGGYGVAGYTRDMREHNKMMKDIEYRDSLLQAVNLATANLLNADLDSFESALYQSMKMLAEAVDVDRVRIWKNHEMEGELYCTELYEWSESVESQHGKDITINVSYNDKIPGWKETLSRGDCVNAFMRNLQKETQEHLSRQGILSILVVPVFVEEKFWGHVGFDECKCERKFTEEEESILRSCSRLLAEAMLRNEMIINIRDTSVKLQAAMEKAIEDEERMQLMLDTMPLACSLINREHKFISMNKASRKLFGVPDVGNITPEEITMMYVQMLPELQPCGGNSLELTHDYIERAFNEGYAKFEWMYVKPDGQMIPCEDTLIRVRYKGENILAGYARDLREQRAIIEEMRKAEIAEESNKAKSKFLANMSHEMRTPMNVVVGLTDLMLEDESLTVNTIENLKKISTAGNTLLGLINDVLDISKIEAGKLELIPVKYDVPSLLNDIITLNVIRIEDKPVKFNLDISDNLLSNLYGDDLRIKQIINNILSNAFKYTQRGTVTLGMTTEHSGESVWVSIYVKDTGIGIREEDIKKIFTDYGQVDIHANRMIEGTGLGLAITKRLTDIMDGEISVESEYGKGSVFHIRIRQGFVEDSTIGKTVAENLRRFRYTEDKRIVSKKLVRPDLSHIRVLVVDDMQTNLDVAAGLLGRYKMQVDCVLNGQEAYERIRRGANNGEPVYNAIFMDHMMPGMDGIETADAIRSLATEYSRNIPIIALTANAIHGMENHFYDHGFQSFLAKPIDIMQLDSIIKKWIC